MTDTLYHPRRLSFMAEAIQSLASSPNLQETLRQVIQTFTDYMEAEAASIFLLENADRDLVCRQCAGPVDINGLRIDADQGIVGKTVREQSCQMVRDVQSEQAFNKAVDAGTGFITRSILCAPLTTRGQKIGALELINKKTGDGLFNAEDQHLLNTLAAAAALAIHNARMASALVEQERVRRELELVREVQVNLLPRGTEESSPVVAVNIPAREVSGDFYDFFTLPDGRVYFNLADVSGKGMNTALWMAKTSGLLRCLAKTTPNLGELVARVNEEICETASHGMFVTLVTGILDSAQDQVTFVNAGHLPVLYRDKHGVFKEIAAGGPPIGVLGGASYNTETVAIDGGSFYLYTDGVSEAVNADGKELGIDGLKNLIEQNGNVAPHERLDNLVSYIRKLGQKQRDDITLMLIDKKVWVLARTALLDLRFRADPAELKMVREQVKAAAEDAGCAAAAAADLVLAVNEACINVMQHAYAGDRSGEMLLEMSRFGADLEVEIKDFAPPMDVSRIKPRDLDDIRPGGLGTHFIREIMDSVEYGNISSTCGNFVRLRKKIN